MSVTAVVLAALHDDSEMMVITQKNLRSSHGQIFGITL
jgi:hypothetical protein